MPNRPESIQLRDIICFDTETTGIGPGAEILQMAIVDGEGEVLFDELVRPKRTKAWPEAQRVHHISPEMVAEKEDIDFHRERIANILEQAKVYVGYNILFDIKMLKYANFSMEPFHRKTVQVIDVMRNFASLHGEWDPVKRRHTWKKLADCAKHYQYDWGTERAHGALADTKATLYCFKKMNRMI